MAYYLDLFNGNPATSGTSVLAAVTGSDTRSDVTDDLVESAYYQALLNTDTVTVASSAATTTNVSWVALYSAATGGTLLKSARIGAHYTIAEGNPVEFLALDLQFQVFTGVPTLTLDTPPSIDTPLLTMGFEDLGVEAGDVLVLQYANNAGFAPTSTATHTADGSDVLAGEYQFSVGPLANGVWYFRAQAQRVAIVSAWSNVVVEDINSGPVAYVPAYYWLGYP